MLEQVKELMNECDEIMEVCMAQMGSMDIIESIDEDSFKMLQKSMSLYKKSKELSIAMAARMDEQDKKLDKILKLLEEK